MKNKYYEDNDSWDWGKFLQGEIIHWMPLPQPPEVLTPHVMRHTFCTRMAMSGMNPKALQYVMGHSDIKMTLGYYTHMTSEGGAGRDGALCHLSAGGTTEFTTFGVVNLEKTERIIKVVYSRGGGNAHSMRLRSHPGASRDRLEND